MRGFSAWALLMLLSGTARAAEHEWPARAGEQRLALWLTNRAGLVTAPFVTSAFPRVSGFGMVLSGGAAAQLPSFGWLRVRLPLSVVRLDFPARAQVAETALGNLELGLEHPLQVEAATRLGFLVAVLAPTAQHGPRAGLLKNRALALGSALNGGKDAALLTPGVTGVRLRASIEHSRYPFELVASVEAPLLLRLSDASLPQETKTHTFGVLPSLELGAAWWLASWFGASLEAGVIVEALRVREPTLKRDRERRLQAVLEPGVHFRVGEHVMLGLDGSVPLAGALGGEAWSVGVLASVGL